MLFDDSLVMLWRWLFTLYVTVWVLQGTETFTVVTYNVENYFLADFGTRKAKSEASRMKVVEFLEAIDADVIALQEMVRRVALTELRVVCRPRDWIIRMKLGLWGWSGHSFGCAQSVFNCQESID